MFVRSHLAIVSKGIGRLPRRFTRNLHILRTPDKCFENLVDYNFKPNYVMIPSEISSKKLRMHYVDEGPRDGEVILCLHGQPTWSYLYRHMIPLLTRAGYRVIAPDFVGFGKSDKPDRRAYYAYASHISWTTSFVEALHLKDITLVAQDWGGLIGLRVLTSNTALFSRVILSNTGLPTATDYPPILAKLMRFTYRILPVLPLEETFKQMETTKLGLGFLYWMKYCDATPYLHVSDIVRFASKKLLIQPPEVWRAYDAPFPAEEYKVGAREFPLCVPLFPGDSEGENNKAAWEILKKFDKPFLTTFSDKDPVTKGADSRFQRNVPGAQHKHHKVIKGAGHFVQEDAPEEFATNIIEFCRANPLKKQ